MRLALNVMSDAQEYFVDERTASGERIAAARRSPAHCLYCTEPATSNEHGLTEAVGGRLAARILCAYHNGFVNDVADIRFNSNFAPFVNMLQVQRQRGTVGATFVATGDDGKPVTIVAEGFAKKERVDVKTRDATGRILYAEGDLQYLDRLPPAALSPTGRNLVIAKISNPSANFSVGMDETLTGAVLKAALHFFSGFIGDVPLDVANQLLRAISGAVPLDGSIVRTPFLHEDVFPDSWPARHELTAYNDGDHTLVTILLFSAYPLTVRLPLSMAGTRAVRYTQMPSETFPRFQTDVPRPNRLDWEDCPGKYDAAAYYAPIENRVSRIHNHGTEQAIRARCRRAFESALTISSNYGDLWDRYTMQLQLECFDAAEVRQIVFIGKRLGRQGEEPWRIPVVSRQTE